MLKIIDGVDEMAIKKSEEEKREVSFEGIPSTTEKVLEELSCELNDVEWQNRARELAESNQELAATEAKKTMVVAELNAEVKTAKAKVGKLNNIVSTRHESRQVTVEVIHDYEKGIVSRRRTDTDEIVGSREMTTLERQGSLLDANAFIEDAGRGKR